MNRVYPDSPGYLCLQGGQLQQNHLMEEGSGNRMSSGHTSAEPFGYASCGLGDVYLLGYASTLYLRKTKEEKLKLALFF